jgi:hypothetical protein
VVIFVFVFSVSRRLHEMRASRAVSRVGGYLRLPPPAIGALGAAETSSVIQRSRKVSRRVGERESRWITGETCYGGGKLCHFVRR